MKISKLNIGLLGIMIMDIIFYTYFMFGCGCTSPDCMGPSQIKLLGIPFSRNIIPLLLMPLIIGLVSGIISGIIKYYRSKKLEQSINLLISVFGIIFILVTIYFFVMVAMIQY